MSSLFRAGLVLALLPVSALAQQNLDDLEYRRVELPSGTSKLRVGSLFESEWHEYNNLDFRQLDESTDQNILDSDDRNSFAFTGAALNLAYEVDPQLKFVLGASHRGLWGNDQFGNVNRFGGFAYFNAMYVDIKTGHADPDMAWTFRIGRQFYQLGASGGSPEFALADVLDMVRIDVPITPKIKLVMIPVNVFSLAQHNDSANFVSYVGQSAVQTFNFRGDVLTRRHGAVLELNEVGPITSRAYAFYTDLGALGTGSDITYEGRLGNFADNDWVANFGLHAEASFGPITPYATFDASTGIDRKELVARDVNANGWAIGAGINLWTGENAEEAKALPDGVRPSGLRASVQFYNALGAANGTDGLQYSHGYVSMKGQQVGGLIANRYMGWHPSAYVGMFGYEGTPMERDRKAGTRMLSAMAGYEASFGLRLFAQWWLMQDTGVSYVNFDTLPTLQPPFGYAREEFAATRRYGRTLGNEVDLSVELQVRDEVTLYATGAVMFAGEFYSIPIARVAGTALGSDNPVNPWALSGGTRVRF